MDDNNELLAKQTPARRPSKRLLALLGGLAALLLLAMMCAVAVAGVGGVLWLRSARPAAPMETLLPQAEAAAARLAVTPEAINRIAFIDPVGRLGTAAPDGSARRLLSAPGASYQFPAWSPDGAEVAAVGVDGNDAGVYLWADRADAPRRSVFTSADRAPIYLYWSPDGRQISFLASEQSRLGLWLAPADGSSPARQIASGQPFYWDWTQNSDQLLIHTGGAGDDAQLTFLDPVSRRVGDNLARPGLFQAPGISADGRYLAYAQADGGELAVVIAARADGQRRAAPHVGLAALGWSPTANQLAWTSPRTEQLSAYGPLRLMDAETGEVRTLVRDTVIGFFWSPDGRRIAYLTLAGQSDNPGASRPAGLAAIGPAPVPQHSDLRFRLAVVEVAGGQQRLLTSFRPSPIFVTQFLPFFDQYALSHRLWSPASDALVLPMMDDAGRSSIYVVSAESGEATRVADGTIAFWSWR